MDRKKNYKPIFIIDGNAMAFRAYRTRDLRTSCGISTSIISGMLQMIKSLHKEFQYNILLLCWDSKGGSSYRRDLYEDYKANRVKKDRSFIRQMRTAKSFFKNLNVRQIALPGIEADDILGMLSKQYSLEGYKVVIVSGDRDLWQLINKNVSIWIPGKKKQMIDLKVFLERMSGITPNQFLKMKALKGDSGDNIPGVPGIGDKRALDLIKRFGSLKKIKQSKSGDKYVLAVKNNWKKVKLAFRLSEIIVDPIRFGFDKNGTRKKILRILNKRGVSIEAMAKEIRKYEMRHKNFNSLAEQLGLRID